MIDKNIYVKQAKRLKAIAKDKVLLQDKQLLKILARQVNILKYLQDKFSNQEDLGNAYLVDSILKELNDNISIEENKIKSISEFKYEDESELVDDTNYLQIYLENIYKIKDLDAACEQRLKDNNKTLSSLANAKATKKPDELAANLGIGGANIESIVNNPEYLNQAKEIILGGAINAKINKEVKEGRVYIFDSKPKIIPIFKYITFILTIILSLAIILCGIFAAMVNGIIRIETKKSAMTIFTAVIYILFGLFGFYMSFIIFKSVSKTLTKGNENFIYFYPWPYTSMFLLSAFIFVIFDVNWLWLNYYDFYNWDWVSTTGFYGFRYTYIVILVLLGLNVVLTVICAILNPKRDNDRMQKLIEKYKQELSNQQSQQDEPSK